MAYRTRMAEGDRLFVGEALTIIVYVERGLLHVAVEAPSGTPIAKLEGPAGATVDQPPQDVVSEG